MDPAIRSNPPISGDPVECDRESGGRVPAPPGCTAEISNVCLFSGACRNGRSGKYNRERRDGGIILVEPVEHLAAPLPGCRLAWCPACRPPAPNEFVFDAVWKPPQAILLSIFLPHRTQLRSFVFHRGAPGFSSTALSLERPSEALPSEPLNFGV